MQISAINFGNFRSQKTNKSAVKNQPTTSFGGGVQQEVALAVNGAGGRIGKAIFRALRAQYEGFGVFHPTQAAFIKFLKEAPIRLKLAAMNVSAGRDAKTIQAGLYRDSVFGFFPGNIKVWQHGEAADKTPTFLMETGKGNKQELTKIYSTRNVPTWAEDNIDILVDATGKATKMDAVQPHLDAGKEGMRFLVSAPSKDAKEIPQFLMGINDNMLLPSQKVVSGASCTTTCAAPMVKVLDDALGVYGGDLTTIHASTNSQVVLDAMEKVGTKDASKARSNFDVIPATTGAAKALGNVLSKLKGKLDGSSVRVPTNDGSLTIMDFILPGHISAEDINKVFRAAMKKPEYKGMIAEAMEHSSHKDVIGATVNTLWDPYTTKSLPIHLGIGDSQYPPISLVKVGGWYDNELGYTSRLLTLAHKMGRQIKGLE